MTNQKRIAIIELRRYVIPVDDDFPDATHPDFNARAGEAWLSIERKEEHEYLDAVLVSKYRLV